MSQSEAVKRARHAALGIVKFKFEVFEHEGVHFAVRQPNIGNAQDLNKIQNDPFQSLILTAIRCTHTAIPVMKPGAEGQMVQATDKDGKPVFECGERVFQDSDLEGFREGFADNESFLGKFSEALKNLAQKQAEASQQAKNS